MANELDDAGNWHRRRLHPLSDHLLFSIILLGGSLVGCGILNEDRDGDAVEIHRAAFAPPFRR